MRQTYHNTDTDGTPLRIGIQRIQENYPEPAEDDRGFWFHLRYFLGRLFTFRSNIYTEDNRMPRPEPRKSRIRN